MKRVCIDARRGGAGGIARVTDALVQALADAAEFETVILRMANGESAAATDLVTAHAPLSAGDAKEVPALIAARGIDLFVAPQFYAPLGFGTPVVSWVHDTWPLSHPEWLPSLSALKKKFGPHAEKSGRAILAAYRTARAAGKLFPGNGYLARMDAMDDGVPAWNAGMYALNLARCTHVVTCSHSSRAALLDLFPEIGRQVSVIANPLPPGLAQPPAAVREPVVLHVSKWEPRKNLVRLIRAFAMLARQRADLRLVLVGAPVNPDDGEAVFAAIAASGVGGQIECLRDLSDAELAAQYARASVFVMASLDEGFSIPLLEAMAGGVPIAAAAAGAIPEVAGGAALLFDPRSEAQIAAALARILDDRSLAKALADRGAARLAAHRARDFGSEVRTLISGVLERSGGS